MKIMNLADLHFAEYKDYSEDILVEWDDSELKYKLDHNGKKTNSRLINLANAMIEAREYCVENDIDTVIIAGDISHNRSAVPTVVQNVEYKVLESFKLKGITLIIIKGNHDCVDNSDYSEHSLVTFQNIAKIIDKPTTILRNGTQILCIPFSPNKSIITSAINTFNPLVSTDANIIVAHLGVTGGVTGKNSYVLADQYTAEELRYEDDDIDLVVLGHYHKPQIVPGTDKKMFYAGSPLQNNFNDEGENHGFWIFDTKSKQLDFHPLHGPKFITIKNDNYKDFSKEDLENNFIRIVSTIDEISQIKESIELNENVRIETQKEYETEHRSDISSSMSFCETVRQYANENDFTEEQLEVGLNIVNSILECSVQ